MLILQLLTKYVWPAIVVALLLVIVGLHMVIKHKDATIAQQSIALDQAQALYKEQMLINETNQKEADKDHTLYIKEEKELNRAEVPENCEQAIEWAIEQAPKLK